MNKNVSTNRFAYVTIEQAADYDPHKPETRTESRIVNAVVEAMAVVKPVNQMSVARHIGVPSAALAGAVECETGLRFQEFLDRWREIKLRRMDERHRANGTEYIADSLGFKNRSALWLYMKRMKLDKNK